MFRYSIPKALVVLCTPFLFSCEPDVDFSELSTEMVSPEAFLSGKKDEQKQLGGSLAMTSVDLEQPLQHLVLNAVIPSECGATKFSEVQWKYAAKLFSEEHVYELLPHYLFLNRQAAKFGIGSDYFGENGKYTNLVHRLKKDLDRFWELPGTIEVLGQHNETLNDREKLADIYWYSIPDIHSRAEAYEMADSILKMNKQSEVLPESPLLSSDGLATLQGTIIIGDGLIKLFTETGLEEKIVWTGILSHEWAHQVQFHYLDSWYGNYPFESQAEGTRTMELEADFFAGYYMTHKRGATYNWKRAEGFFELYYQSGDCSFEFEQHHGTPLQREQASYEGYLLAQSAKKKGKILPAEELHEYFLQVVLPRTVGGLQYL